MTEDNEKQAKRLFPHIREQLHSDDELLILAKKMEPFRDDLEAQKVGRFFIKEALGVLREALWSIGAGVLAALAYIKWTGK